MAEKKPSTAAQRFCAAGIGAGVAETLTLPVDAAKVRLQMQVVSAGQAPKYTGLLQGMRTIGAEEGVAVLWRGIQPALVRQVSYTGMSFVLYDPVRNFISGGCKPEEITFVQRVLSGGTAGGISIIMMNPTDVIKTQMQVSSKGTGTGSTMMEITSNIWKGGGLGAFWKGWQPNVGRCFIGNACEIGCYDQAKTMLKSSGVPDGPLAHFGASGVAGTVSAIFSTPVDVVKTRLMAQAGGASTEGVVQYSGVVDCFMRMPRLEGISSLYKGFVPIAARKVLWTVAYFLTYEQALKLIRGTYS